jgi:hypothetical protein
MASLQHDEVIRTLGTLAGLSAVANIILSIAWLVEPQLLASFVIAWMAASFLFAFVCLVILSYGYNHGRRFRREIIVAAWNGLSRNMRGATAVIALLGVLGSVGGLFASRGYSQNPKNTLARCPWSITNNHDQTNTCVSHARWLSVGEAFAREFVGLTAFFLILAFVLFMNINSFRDTRAA